MFKNILQNRKNLPIRQKSGEFLLCQTNTYLSGLQKQLNKKIDARFVRTFYDLFIALTMFRNRPMGLLLTELGGYVNGFDSAPAGTKRISNLLRCKKWGHKMVDDFLFERGKERIKKLADSDKRPVFLWDDSRIEKSESSYLEGLCTVFSSKGQRLTRIRKGFYKPPIGRICTTGFQWTAVTLTALGEVPSLFHMSWWTTKGKHKEDGSNIIYRTLKKITTEITSQIIPKALHVFDRGFANCTMLEWLKKFEQDFVIRWKSNHNFINEGGQLKKIHLIARSYKGVDFKLVKDKQRNKTKHISIAWAGVKHPEQADNQLYLIIIRDKNNYGSPMYLLTNLNIEDKQTAWEMFFTYMHRWGIEQTFRCCKSELSMESPRLWFFENMLKLLAIVSLVYDFLLRMLCNWKIWTKIILRKWCHRTGKRYALANIPFYRLRAAISLILHALLFERTFQEKGWFDSVT